MSKTQATKFYESWIRDGLWELGEAIDIFAGVDPKTMTPVDGALEHEFLSVQRFSQKGISYYNRDKESWDSLIELAERHIAAGLLKKSDHGPGPYFKPVDIIKWLLSVTNHQPSSTLLSALGITPSENKKIKDSEYKTLISSANRRKGPTLEQSKEEIYKKAMPIMKDFVAKHNREPSRGEISELLKNTHRLSWTASSIERSLSKRELQNRFDAFKSQGKNLPNKEEN